MNRDESLQYVAYIGCLPGRLAYQAGLAVVGQPSCGLQVHIPADLQICRQLPTKHSIVQPAEAGVCADQHLTSWAWLKLSAACHQLLY